MRSTLLVPFRDLGRQAEGLPHIAGDDVCWSWWLEFTVGKLSIAFSIILTVSDVIKFVNETDKIKSLIVTSSPSEPSFAHHTPSQNFHITKEEQHRLSHSAATQHHNVD
jgi:hypothetical protein